MEAGVGEVVLFLGGHPSGVVIVEPDQDTIEEYLGYQERRQIFQMSLREGADLEPVTRDGVEIEILGEMCDATLITTPLYDADGAQMRG